MQDSIPVTVVTGFLGAGKSTLVERWLSDLPRDETAVIVNEQGEVGIDGELLAAHVSRVREITGGCICCATQAELGLALAELAETEPAPTRILVETSGAASPAGVIRALSRGRASDRLRLDGVVTVVDATRLERTLGFDLAVEQLGFADVVVMSHVDRSDDIDMASVQAQLERLAPGAVITHSRRESAGEPATCASLMALLDEREGVLRIIATDTGQRHRAIDTVSLSLEDELDEARFGDWVEDALGAVEARILRVKGILAIAGIDARVVLQGVGETIEITFGAPWDDAARNSRLVILGLGLDGQGLEAGFASCRVAPGDTGSA